MINDILYTYLCMNIGMKFTCTVWNEEKECEVLTTAVLNSVDTDGYCRLTAGDIDITAMYYDVIPTLYRMSDMTAGQIEYFRGFLYKYEWTQSLTVHDIIKISEKSAELISWLNENKFDYLGLIEKGKAFDAKANNEVLHF